MSNNTALEYLDCGSNLFTTDALNTLFGTLHSNTIEGGKTIDIRQNPGKTDCSRDMARNKGWEVVY